jgi:TPR repeat protein
MGMAVRIFLSFNGRDRALAESVRKELGKLRPDADIFFSPESLGHGLWIPKLADGVQAADGFLLVLGPNGAGPWQTIEYYEAFDRHVREPAFAIVPLIAPNACVSGLRYLHQLNWIDLPETLDDQDLRRVWAALKGDGALADSGKRRLVQPYRGLEAMTEADADYFFGRETETSAVLSLLAAKPGRLPLLIGASGVGKSSVAQAGVLSALKAMRLPPGQNGTPAAWPEAFRHSRTSWAWLVVRPGDDPMGALAAAFARLWLSATDPELGPLTRQWAEGLRTRNTLSDLIEATQLALDARDGVRPERILVYLDQGEELYTRAARTAPKDAALFSALLAEGMRDPRLIAFGSLRADYFDRLQADPALFAVYEHVNVPPLMPVRLHDVVTGPPKSLGVAFEDDRLPARIVEAAAQPSALPLLSYLLTDMWTAMLRRGDNVLRLPLDAIDVGGVLAARAEQFLKENPAAEAALKRLLTLRLALVPAEGEPVRRPARRAECTAEEWALAEQLADHPWRLAVSGEREADGEVRAEVAHEALLHAWPRLAGWLRDERDFLVFKGDVERAERRWREMGRDDKALLTGLDLNRAAEWLPKRGDDLSDEVRAFVSASIAIDRAAKTRALRYQRRVTAGAVIAALILAAVGGVAILKWRDAEEQTRRAEEQSRNAANAVEVFEILFSGAQNVDRSIRTVEELDREWSEKVNRVAIEGNPLAERAAGIFAYYGRGVSQDYAQAREWLEKAAAKGDTVAMRFMGALYQNGQGVPQDYAKAREWYEKAAAKNDANAMILIGGLYAYGHGAPQDYAKAREWFEKAAAKHNAAAMFLIGLLYEGVPPPQDHAKTRQVDYAKAREWYEKAAVKDDATAMHNIGVLYDNGRGVPQDYAKAREWYQKAAAKDDAAAMHNIGVLYDNGHGVPQDYAKAREWYEKAAAKDNAVAMHHIGVLYAYGHGVPQDYAKAREWYEKAAAKDNAAAMTDVGVLYANGQGVPQDYARALEWYEKAAARGNAPAMSNIGTLYANGRGVPRDYAEAREWYEKAAAKDNAAAMTLIGVLYADGRDVPQNYAKALEWYEKAAAKGNAIATVLIGQLHANGQGVPQDYAKAREWYEKAAGQGVPPDHANDQEYEKAAATASVLGMRLVGQLYASGQGVPQDYAKALEWREKAAGTVEAREIEEAGKPAAETAEALGEVAWYALFAREPARALAAVERALSLAPAKVWLQTNHAHALMFLGRTDEAQEIYLREMDKIIPENDNKPWQRVIVEDFAELRNSGLSHPMMAEIEAAFQAKR